MNKRWIVWGLVVFVAATLLIMAVSLLLDPNWLARPNWVIWLLLDAVKWTGGALLALAAVVLAYPEFAKHQRRSRSGRPQPAPRREARSVPQPGALPAGSKPPPFISNPHFTGRDADLILLYQRLVQDRQPEPVVLTGVGGSGKSQLAGEFLYRYGRHFASVHWLNAARPELIEGELADCGRAMAITPWPEKQPEQVSAVLQEWRDDPRRLVVFDNLEQPAVLNAWLPRLGGVRVLVTARQTDWRDFGRLQEVEPLEPDPGRGLLRSLAPRLQTEPDADLDRVTTRLGGLPLALEIAGLQFKVGETMTPQAFLQGLDQQGGAARALVLRLSAGSKTHSQHTPDLLATFLSSWELLALLDTVDGLARRILRCAGWCAPNAPIPPGVLEGAVEALKEDGNPEPAPPASGAFDLALARLYGLGLLERGAGGPAIHPLLADFARVVEGLQSCGPAVAESLVGLGNTAYKSGLYTSYLPLLPHVEQAAAWSESEAWQPAANLWNTLGRYYQAVAAYSRARQAYERALEISEKALPPGHPDLGTRHNNLGLLLQDLGALPAAREHLERALAISEQALPPEHPDLGTRHSNLGNLLRDLGALPAAREHLERALAISEQALPPEHPDLGTRHNNLGLLLKDLGELPAAREHLERALEIDQKALGNDHPGVATDLNNLGMLLRDLGALPAARAHLERALAIGEQALPPGHPTLGTRHNNLGLLLQDLGELPAARVHLERALAIGEQALPPEHPDLGAWHNNLGELLQDLGELPAARAHLERALAISEKALPPGHPHLGTRHNNLGTLLYSMGELPAARAHLERALAILTASLPENHQHIQWVRENLAGVIRRMRDG